jgi:hypothetical protein
MAHESVNDLVALINYSLPTPSRLASASGQSIFASSCPSTATLFASWMEKPKLGLRVDGYLLPSFNLSQQTIGKSYFSDRVCRFRGIDLTSVRSLSDFRMLILQTCPPISLGPAPAGEGPS